MKFYCAPYAPLGPRPRNSEGNFRVTLFGQKVWGQSVVLQKGQHWRPKFALFWPILAKFGKFLGKIFAKIKFLAKKFVKRRRRRFAPRLPKNPDFSQKTRGVTADFRSFSLNRPSRLAEFSRFLGKKIKNVKRRGVFFDVQFGCCKNMAAVGDWDGNIN